MVASFVSRVPCGPPPSVTGNSCARRGEIADRKGNKTRRGCNEFRISLADERRDYFKEIRNYLISGEKVINSGETN